MSTPLELARIRQAELRAAGELVRLTPEQKALADPASLRKALVAHCVTCHGGSTTPAVRREVANCTAWHTCFLWPHRPWQRLSDRAREVAAYRGQAADGDDEAEDA